MDINNLLTPIENRIDFLKESLEKHGTFTQCFSDYAKHKGSDVTELDYLNDRISQLQALLQQIQQLEERINNSEQGESFSFEIIRLKYIEAVVRRAKDLKEAYIKNNPPLTPTAASQPIQPEQPEAEQQAPTFKNNFDSVAPIKVYTHFKAGLVEKGYLTEQELNSYLKAAFEMKQPPQTRFRFTNNPSKGRMVKIFRAYYLTIACSPHGKRLKYIELLGEYFEGYETATISRNFK